MPTMAPEENEALLDMDEVAKRLDFLELTPEDQEHVRAVAPQLQAAMESFVDDFYAHLERFPHTSGLIQGRLEGLRRAQTEYFHSLLRAEVDWAYVTQRLRVGQAHDWVGLAPEWYLSAFNRYLLNAVGALREPLQAGDEPTWIGLQSLIKLIFFDMGLAVDAYLRARERRLQNQQQALRELSAPVIEVWEDVLVLPLVGTMDTQRAQEVTEALLNGVTEKQARVAIIDITGLPVMDTSTANHLFKTVRAVELLGTVVIVTGVRPAIAQTIVGLGIDTSMLRTQARLADGLRLALEVTGRQVVSSGWYSHAGPADGAWSGPGMLGR